MKLTIKLTLIMSILLLAACDDDSTRRKAGKPLPMRTHVCTEEQAKRVEYETKVCNANTSYFSADCYNSAIRRICTERLSK